LRNAGEIAIGMWRIPSASLSDMERPPVAIYRLLPTNHLD
jgi:hypothetical protein